MKPNIFFLVIDALRADKFYGQNKTSITPNIDSLLQKGVYFEQAISSADATILSWTAMFTGKYPFKTGIFTSRFNKLNENTVTYFDIFKKDGYHFYAYLPIMSEALSIFPRFENIDSYYTLTPRFFEGLGEKIIKKLKSNQMRQPWFFYVHPYNLHFPIIVPTGFNDKKYGESDYEKTLSAVDVWIGKIFEHIDVDNTLLVISADHGSYIQSMSVGNKQINFEVNGRTQAVIAKLASKTPKFLEPLKKRAFFSLENIRKNSKLKKIENLELKPHQKRALLAQRSDIEKFLFDEKVKIPLLFIGYEIKNKKIISQQVRSVDILPTIADIADISHETDIDGTSLKPLIDGEQMDELPAYMESSPMIQVKSNDVVGLRTSHYKYFRDKHDPTKRIHLYDLINDPYEDNNIADTHKHVVKEMETTLQTILQNNSVNVDTNVTDSVCIEDELKKLGYV